MGIDVEMIAVVGRRLSDEEVKRAAVRMQIAFGGASGSGLLWVDRGKHHSLTLIDPTSDMLAETGIANDGSSSYIRLNSLGRFYGSGYERGDIVGILAVARYMRSAFPGAEVYYGGDSGGGLRLLDAEYESDLWGVFTSELSRRYFNHSRGDETETVCDFCEVRTNTYSWSAAECITRCPSCGQQWKYVKATKQHVLHEEKRK